MSKLPVPATTYGETIDKCISDLFIKTGTGVVVGGLFSLLFKRRKWPMTLGAGIGMGMTYTTCENRFRFTYGNNNEQLQNSTSGRLTVPTVNTDNIITKVGESDTS